jgi:hypothetical protein
MTRSCSRLRGWTSACAALALATIAIDASAQTYSVEINPTLNGLDIKVEPVATSAMLIVNLTNNTDGKVRCDLRYDASPQPIYRKTTYVEPGKTEPSVFKAKRKWYSVSVNVECNPVQK